MHIVLDIDNTLSETSQPTLDAVNKHYGTNYTLKDWNSWLLSDCFSNCPDIDNFALKLFNDPDFMYDLPLVEGALEGAHFFARKYEIIYLTAREDNMTKSTVSWLLDNAFPGGRVYFGVRDKSLQAKEFSAQFAVDDAAHHAKKIASVTPVYLLDYPWNQHCETADKGYPIVRVANWEEIINIWSR